MMEKTISLIKKFFEDDNWKFDFKEYKEQRAVFVTGISMNNAIGSLKIFVFVYKDYYVVNAVLNSFAEKKYYSQVAEYLHRANLGMSNGNFEFDYEDGEVRYKTYVNFENIELSDKVVRDSILIPVFMYDRYGKGLLRLMLCEDDPQRLINEVEKEAK